MKSTIRKFKAQHLISKLGFPHLSLYFVETKCGEKGIGIFIDTKHTGQLYRELKNGLLERIRDRINEQYEKQKHVN